MKDTNDYIELDKQLLWHPYTSMTNPSPHFLVDHANGCEVTLATGETLVDGMSSWWSVIHGYNHPKLNQALKNQIDDFAHIMFGGLTHRPAIELAETLVNISPQGLTRVFLSDSGSVSVEVSLKMAIQYWNTQGHPEKQFFATSRSGYHGDTFAAMSVCDPVNGMHGLFSKALTSQYFVSAPPTGFNTPLDPSYLEEIETLFKQHHEVLAGFIIEPVVQNAGGMRFYNPRYLDKIRALCDQYNILLIFDEIATGFGRTGKMFAADHCNISPDLMCVGKALTGGYMTLAATLTNDKVALGISDNDGVFMHGPTFMGNALACSVANASLELIQSNDIISKVNQIEGWLNKHLSRCATLSNVKSIRCLGAIGVVELNTPVNLHEIQPKFVEKGVWIRPFGKLIYLMPPYIITEQEIEKLSTAIFDVASELG
ncbi:adenosylmethionine--8-amino-7-oxononanoate transaminase [Marinomonas mediterranea]|uniref:adenosylmethionine--8-amino-7-oxononanoate transaminase n=1 Tax=Marinomonas mediterranea TaxID=119864 RepID=UPI00234A34C2|nr:adenosylmethionine--8-amino-7-oxononanoate transaminase [Marinomonas mediterranea]WCN10417.1 adenosylmethionine--8-amino-7-oxononanoate transaminase [Marinomonas mediterranea]